MSHRTRQERRQAALARLRKPSSDEEARLSSAARPYLAVSLVLQGLFLVIGIRTLREMYRTRDRGPRPVLSAASGPLLGLLGLHLAQVTIDRRLRRRVRTLHDTPPA